jgi:hypothetical protein
MIIATFNAATGWAGKSITHDEGVFTLEGHGPITAQDVLSYDAAGHIEWAYDGLKDWTCQLCQSPAEPVAPTDRVLFQGMSHESGRNAMVTLYPNRIEREKQRSRASFSKALQDFEVTPIKSVTSVRARKHGMRRTKVTVYASASAIDFRFEHAEAHAFKDAIMALILANS